MSFTSSQTAASAALETMNAGCEVGRGYHLRPLWVPMAASSTASSMSTRQRHASSMYAPPRTLQRTPSMYSSSSLCRRLRRTAPRAGLSQSLPWGLHGVTRCPPPCSPRGPHPAALRTGHTPVGLPPGHAMGAWGEPGCGVDLRVCGSPHLATRPSLHPRCAQGGMGLERRVLPSVEVEVEVEYGHGTCLD